MFAPANQTHFTLKIVPQLAYLARRANQRIFQHLSVPQIIAQVLKHHGILDGVGHLFQLGPVIYPERYYCVPPASTFRVYR